MSVYHLENVLDGDLDEFIDQLASAEQAKKLESLGE